jgi:uncharacterized protein YndB with AHSA1/START domain
MNDTTPTGEATVTRVFDAPREHLWRYFTEPELFAAWFGTPPYTTDPASVEMDLRPGGAWKATMVHESDGSELPFGGTFVEISPPERLVQTFADPADPSAPGTETLTTTLADLGDGRTEVTYQQVGALPPEQYPLIVEGVTGFYERLAQHLAAS